MKKISSHVTREIGNFIWNGFTDPSGVGVSLADVLDGAALVGVDLTDEQKESVLNHIDNVDLWTFEDEEVRDLIAEATDNATYEQLFAWLVFVVGDNTAEALVEEWEEEE